MGFGDHILDQAAVGVEDAAGAVHSLPISFRLS